MLAKHLGAIDVTVDIESIDALVPLSLITRANGIHQIEFLLKKIVNHHLEASLGDRGCFEDMSPVIGGSGQGSAHVLRCGRRCLIPPLRKADLGTLAEQLQVTRTELGEFFFFSHWKCRASYVAPSFRECFR